jgi:predicted permease
VPDYRWLRRLFLRLRTLSVRGRVEHELEEEFQFHIEQQMELEISRGLSPEEAHLAARRAIGGVEQRKEECRDMRRLNLLEDFIRDLRYAIRILTRTPSWTALAALTVALGICGAATMFSIVNAVLLRPLPFAQPQQLYWIGEQLFGVKQEFQLAADYFTMRERTKAFIGMAAFDTTGVNWTGTARPEQLTATRVTASFFPLLGVPALRGRSFRTDDDRPKANLTTVLSYGLWRDRFGADPAIIGKTIRLDRQPAVVIGIMPARFDFPKGSQLWMPFRLNEIEQRRRQNFTLAKIIARAREDVSAARVKEEITRLTPIVEDEYHANGVSAGAKILATPLQQRLTGQIRPALLVLMGAVLLMLAIVCFNVANLTLARAAGNHREMLIRAALGAPRKRIVRQVMIENLLVSLLGGGIGIALATVATAALNSSRPIALVGFAEITVDTATLGFTFLLSALIGLVFSLAPALHAPGSSAAEALRQQSRNASGLSLRRLRQALVVAQVAASLTLLIGAGLLAESFLKLRNTDPGFRPDRVLTARVNLTGPGYSSDRRQIAFYESVLEKLRANPSVISAALTTSIPWNGDNLPNSAVFRVENRPVAQRGREPQTSFTEVSPDFFKTLSIPLLEGRLLDSRDRLGSAEAIVVNQTFRRLFFPGEDPVGHRISVGDKEYRSVWLEIVGVAGDIRQNGLDRDAEPWFYQSYIQSSFENIFARMGILIRTVSDPALLSSSVPRVVASIDPDQPAYDVKTMDQRLADSLASRRFNATWIGCFAAAALLIAAIGVYGVMSYLVTLRTHEVGVRLTQGARPGQILQLILREGLTLGMIGCAIGLAGAWAFRPLLASLLFGVTRVDPAVCAGFTAALLLAALAACLGPALRAARVDPATSLRHD